MNDFWHFLTQSALFELSTNSAIWNNFYDAEYPLDIKIKKIGLKYKTKALISHDKILEGRDNILTQTPGK